VHGLGALDAEISLVYQADEITEGVAADAYLTL
jgi:hypothetical protein